MSQFKIIVIDIDRTTLTDNHQILPEVIDAIGKARSSGIDVIPATARSPEALRPIMAQTNLTTTAVCFNGAWTGCVGEETSEVYHGFPLTYDLTSALVSASDRAGLNPCWFTPEQWYAGVDGPLVKREINATGTSPVFYRDVAPDQGPIYKVLCLENPETANFIDEVHANFAAQADFVRSDTHLVEVVSRGISKRSAIVRLAEEHRISRACVAAIGDSENDLELIKWAGMGIAMGNATAAVKDSADWITQTNENAGVAVAIERLLTVTPAI